jgi:succinate dehydrogenase / fumarate reductase iron-sulfur subunit
MAAGVSLSRLLAELPQSQRDTLCRTYRRAIYEGCGKSLACGEICPAGIDTEHLLSRSNAVAVWGRYL